MTRLALLFTALALAGAARAQDSRPAAAAGASDPRAEKLAQEVQAVLGEQTLNLEVKGTLSFGSGDRKATATFKLDGERFAGVIKDEQGTRFAKTDGKQLRGGGEMGGRTFGKTFAAGQGLRQKMAQLLFSIGVTMAMEKVAELVPIDGRPAGALPKVTGLSLGEDVERGAQTYKQLKFRVTGGTIKPLETVLLIDPESTLPVERSVTSQVNPQTTMTLEETISPAEGKPQDADFTIEE